MYRCGICGGTSEIGQPMLRHVIYRIVRDQTLIPQISGKVVRGHVIHLGPPRKQIAREIPVCRDCHGDITWYGFDTVMAERARTVVRAAMPSLVNQPVQGGRRVV